LANRVTTLVSPSEQTKARMLAKPMTLLANKLRVSQRPEVACRPGVPGGRMASFRIRLGARYRF